MLIEFTVENFRSIKEPVTLSMVAAPGKKNAVKPSTRRKIKSDHEIASPFRDESRNLELLPAIVIFGANASGKSNVLQALDSLITFIQARPIFKKTFGDLSVPFGLNVSTKEAPTHFKLRIIRDATIFTYTLILNRACILHEKLEYIPPAPRLTRNRLLFERTWREDEKAYVVTTARISEMHIKKFRCPCMITKLLWDFWLRA